MLTDMPTIRTHISQSLLIFFFRGIVCYYVVEISYQNQD